MWMEKQWRSEERVGILLVKPYALLFDIIIFQPIGEIHKVFVYLRSLNKRSPHVYKPVIQALILSIISKHRVHAIIKDDEYVSTEITMAAKEIF